jgi:branched-chain amino acid transport system substrate-binding protein
MAMATRLLPRIRVKTSAADFAPIEQLQMTFTGGKWVLFGAISSAETER